MDDVRNLKFKKMDFIKPLTLTSNFSKILFILVWVALVFGATTGYILSQKPIIQKTDGITFEQGAKAAQQDTRTFRDFAEGTIQAKPQPKDPNEYTEGTHILLRTGATPVTLTSSVVDLSQYEGKEVKVYGETQKAIKEGWLMDVGRIKGK